MWPEAGSIRLWNLFLKLLTVPSQNSWRVKLGSSPSLWGCVLSFDTISYGTSRVHVREGFMVSKVAGSLASRERRRKYCTSSSWSFFHAFYLLFFLFLPSLPLQIPLLIPPPFFFLLPYTSSPPLTSSLPLTCPFPFLLYSLSLPSPFLISPYPLPSPSSPLSFPPPLPHLLLHQLDA